MVDRGTGTTDTSKPDPDHVPLDAEAKRLKLEQSKAESRKAIAEAEQKIAEAHKSALLAKLPTTDITPLEGKIDVGQKSGLPADLLAHSLVTNAAGRIAKAIDGKLGNDPRVLIVEDRNLAKVDWPYEAVRRQLTEQMQSVRRTRQLLRDRMRPPAGEPVLFDIETAALERVGTALGTATAAVGGLSGLGAAATVGPAAVGALAAVAGMFHSDYSISGRDVTISPTPLLAAVANALAKDNRELTIAGFHLVRDTAIITDFWNAWDERVKLEQLKLQLASRDVAPVDQEIADVRAQFDAAVAEHERDLAATDIAGNPPAHAGLEALRAEMERLREEMHSKDREVAAKRAAVAIADTVIQRFDTFATATTTAPADGGYPPLVAAAIQERLRGGDGDRASGDKPFTRVLFVALEAAGGETITRRNLFLGSRLRYVGGAHFSFLLLDTDTNVTVVAGNEALLGSLKYRLFWIHTGPRDPQVKRLDLDYSE